MFRKIMISAVLALSLPADFANAATATETQIAQCVLSNMSVNKDRINQIAEVQDAWDRSGHALRVSSAVRLLWGNQDNADADIVTVRELTEGPLAGSVYVGVSERRGMANHGDVAYVIVGSSGLMDWDGNTINGFVQSFDDGVYEIGLYDRQAHERVRDGAGQLTNDCLSLSQ